jgi:predicted secreted Zn-dependent protease
MKSLRRFCFLIWMVAPFLPGSHAFGQDQLTLRTNYYYVTGNTAREIRESMAGAKPARLLHDAQTDWHIDWKFTTPASDGNCSIQTLTLRTTIISTLPRWAAPTNSPPELLRAWKEYAAALEKHEGHHRMIAQDTAKALRSHLAKIQGPCATFEKTVNVAADKILAEFKKKEADYDLKTEHGRTEGAHFP